MPRPISVSSIPHIQAIKFDSSGDYVRRWVPELAKLAVPDIHAPWDAPALTLAGAGVTLGRTYPKPMVEHGPARARARARVLNAFKTIRAD